MKTVNGFQPSTFVTKTSVLDVTRVLDSPRGAAVFQLKVVATRRTVNSKSHNAWIVLVFGVFLVRIFPNSN